MCLSVVACNNDGDPTVDKASFVKIYNSNRFNDAYLPIDIQQTADGGYLILGSRKLEESNFKGVYIMKLNEFGDFISEQLVDEQYVNPIGSLLPLNDSYFFFCMTELGVSTQLIELSSTGDIAQIVNIGYTYPAAAALDGSNFILLGYDNASKESVVSIISPAGVTLQSATFSVGAGDAIEEPIINHFLQKGRQFPFQVGKTLSGQYFFNGFYNYTFSLVFTDLGGGGLGVVQGQQDDGGISHLVQLSGNTFATARFNFGDNYFLPNIILNTSGISSSTDLGGFTLPELVSNAPVKILLTTLKDTEIIIFASNTKSGQIGIYFYAKSTGEFLGSRYLGFSNPYEINNMISTSDDGLAIGATTYVTGRFPRIALFKLSKEELSKIF